MGDAKRWGVLPRCVDAVLGLSGGVYRVLLLGKLGRAGGTWGMGAVIFSTSNALGLLGYIISAHECAVP